MTEEKKIKFKLQNKEISSPMPSSYDDCISSFKKCFSINDEQMKKITLFYNDKDGDQIKLEGQEDFLNFSEDNGKLIEGEIETKKEKENEKEEIPKPNNNDIKDVSNLSAPSLITPKVICNIANDEIKEEGKDKGKEKEKIDGEKKLNKLEDIISNDKKEEKNEIKNENNNKEKNEDKEIVKENNFEEDKKINEINDEKLIQNNVDENIKKIEDEKNKEQEKENNKNNNNIKKEKCDDINNKNKENGNNIGDTREIINNNFINNNVINDNNITNNANKNNTIKENKENKKCCKMNCFIIISVIIVLLSIAANIIGVLYFIHKNKLENADKKIIIGIDFGSTFSGYSIIYDSNINFDDFDQNQIVSSELIMDNETQIGLKIGNKAHYFPKNRIKPENKLYFYKFKKNLDPKNNNNYAKSNVPEGYQIELTKLIKGFLVLLKEEIENNNQRVKTTNINDIKWIITVPPLWDEKGKKFMKEVAYQSGMIHSEIALEPEAASLSIFHDKNIKKKYLQKGKTFLIVDAGGYSVDISANKIIDDNNNLEQLLEPSSEKLGSNLINERIIEIIEEMCGKKTIEEVKQNNYEAWEKTLDEIEEKKKEIDDNTAENFKIEIKFDKNICNKFFSGNCEGNYKGTKISYTNTHIDIPSHIIIDIISEIATNIVNLINKSFSKSNENINLIVLTGGFSNCKIFEKKIRNNFRDSFNRLEFLKKPQETVMKGAAIFGLFPNQILYRISPVTIAVNHYIDAKEDDECNDLKDENGNSLCLNYLIFVERGKSVKTNKDIEKIIRPINNTINIYYAFDDEINEKEINILDTLDIPSSDLPLENRTITVSMKFSNYINVTVMDKESEEVNWKIVYYPS